MYPAGATSPKFRGYQTSLRKTFPLGLLWLADVLWHMGWQRLLGILKPLFGRSMTHVSNTKEFAGLIKSTKLEEGKWINPSDVTVLFTAVPVAYAIDIIKQRLKQDTKLPKRIIIPTNNIIELLGFCLNTTYFLFQGHFYEQTKVAAMESPVMPIVPNLYIEEFKHRAITTAVNPSRIWKRYADDTFVIKQWLKQRNVLKANQFGRAIYPGHCGRN